MHVARGQDAAETLCAGQPIERIEIRASAPTTALFRKVPGLTEIVGAVHTTTNVEIIRRFLLLQEGDACIERRRAESERILRAQPFIADATVRTLAGNNGQVVIDVRTTDEIALVLNIAGGHGRPPFRLIRVGDSNLGGEGVYVAGNWRSGGVYRDGYGGRFVDNQFLGHPWIFETDINRNPIGDDWQVNAVHPFYTDFQRIAWIAQGGANDDYVQFRNDVNSSHAIHVSRGFWDVGGVFRFGHPGRLGLFGGSFSGDDERSADRQVLVTNEGFKPDTSALLLGRYSSHNSVRANMLLGFRDIGFVQVRGFDALSSTQDLPVGFQVGTMFGRSLRALGSRDDDYFVGGDVYIGAGNHHGGTRIQLEGEARHDSDLGGWDGMLTDDRSIQYVKFTHTNTTSLALEFSGGWRQRFPSNLSLSDPIGGVRGYSSSNTPGARRAVMRLEDHQFLNRPFNAGDFGVGAFVDAGKLWAGDIPYGVTTPVRATVGLSLLATVPAASARLWRIDFTYALRPELGGRRFEVRFGSTDKTTFFLPEPDDIQSTRERTVPSSVFRWP